MPDLSDAELAELEFLRWGYIGPREFEPIPRLVAEVRHLRAENAELRKRVDTDATKWTSDARDTMH